MPRRPSFAKDYRDLHGEVWPPERTGERTVEIEVDVEIERRPHLRRDLLMRPRERPAPPFNLPTRIGLTFAALYAGAMVLAGFAFLIAVAWVFVLALLGAGD